MKRNDAEMKYRTLFEQSPYGILVIDTEGRFLDFNETAHRSLGYTKEEFADLTIADIDPVETSAGIRARINTVLKDGRAEFEARHRTKQGQIRDIHVTVQAFASSGQTVLHAIWRDITSCKRAGDMLRETNTRLETLIQAIPDMVFFRDAGGRYVMTNKAVEEICGLRQEDLVGKTNFELFPREMAEMCDRSDQEAIRKGEAVHAEERARDAAGRQIFLDTIKAPVYDGGGSFAGLLCVARDITQRRTAEEALRRNEEFIRNILDNVDEGFLVVDRDFRIVAANRAYCAWGDTPREEIIGRRCFEVSHRATRPCHEEGEDCSVKRAFETGRPYTAIHKHVDDRGNILYVETKAFPLRDSTGAVTSAIETIHNITERHLLEAEQLKTQKLEAIGRLAGGIAHDFNNLLQGMFGYISMARVNLDRKEKAGAMLDQAEKALNMSVSLAGQLLTFSKGGKPVTKKIAPGAVIENSANFALSGSRSDSRITLDDNLWHVEADEGQLGQVIQNIVLNANEAMPDGGMVEISAQNTEIPRETNPLLPEGGTFVKITVKDRGIGIPGQYLPRIFDPYFTTKQKGSGLGLATSYSIIRNHGGTIEVASEVNRGTTFSIYLPASTAEEEDEIPAAPSASARKGKILVMDDEDIIRDVVQAMIESLGHAAECAATGEEAIGRFAEALNAGRPFDIVILDLTVKGGMGGEQTVSRIREMDPAVKAVVSSGYADDPIISDYRSHGFDAFLDKPYMIDVLRDTLNALLG